MKRGEIYYANLNPTIGSEINKVRPAIIISNDINNEFSSTITVLPITTSQNKVYPFEVFLTAQESGLIFKSKIKSSQIRTIHKQRLKEYIGKFSLDKIQEIEKSILVHLGF